MDKDRVKGNLKKTKGKVTGDRDSLQEGREQEAWGKTKDKGRDLVDSAKQKTR